MIIYFLYSMSLHSVSIQIYINLNNTIVYYIINMSVNYILYYGILYYKPIEIEIILWQPQNLGITSFII